MTESQKAFARAQRKRNQETRAALAAGQSDPHAAKPGDKLFGLPAAVVMVPVSLITVPFLGLFLWCLPGEIARGMGGTNTIGNTWACEDKLRPTLKDPGSYQRTGDYHSKSGDKTTITYRAKNSFGGYTDGSFTCSN